MAIIAIDKTGQEDAKWKDEENINLDGVFLSEHGGRKFSIKILLDANFSLGGRICLISNGP